MGTCTSKPKQEKKLHPKSKMHINGRTLGIGEREIYKKIIRRNRNLKSLIDPTVYEFANRSVGDSDISTLIESKSNLQFTNDCCNIQNTLSDCEHEDIDLHFQAPNQSQIHEFKAQPFELELRNFLLDEEEAFKTGELSACRVLYDMLK